jgi:hypothetical protein
MLIIVLALVGILVQQPAARPADCQLAQVNGRWQGACGTLFDAAATLTLSPSPSITSGMLRAGAKPTSVWAGEMRIPDDVFPAELEIYADGTGVLRLDISWHPVRAFTRTPERLRFEVDLSRTVPPSELDRTIVKRAAEILSSESVWNRADNRLCGTTDKTWSIYCAMQKACIEVTGGFHHRRPALEAVRTIVDERSAGRNYAHRLQDYNNDPSTKLADVQSLFAEALARMNR